jgi:hypothetical protein
MPQATFDGILEEIDRLDEQEQADLLEVARRRLAQPGHQRVIGEINAAKAQFAAGTAQPASVDDLMREIES